MNSIRRDRVWYLNRSTEPKPLPIPANHFFYYHSNWRHASDPGGIPNWIPAVRRGQRRLLCVTVTQTIRINRQRPVCYHYSDTGIDSRKNPYLLLLREFHILIPVSNNPNPIRRDWYTLVLLYVVSKIFSSDGQKTRILHHTSKKNSPEQFLAPHCAPYDIDCPPGSSSLTLWRIQSPMADQLVLL